MKQVLTSASLLALGAGSLFGVDPEMSRQQSGRLYSLSATVRGFYDDNINTSPNNNQESIGLQVSPSVHFNFPLDQTFISVGYTYSLYWYENREPHDIDQFHEFNAKLRHQFSPRHQIAVDDTFVITSEPTAVNSFGIITTPTRGVDARTRGSVLHNNGSIDDTFQLTSLWGLSFGYVNNWYDYEAEGVGSRSALLDRIEHLFRADARYQFNPKLVGIVGYSFGFTTFTGDDLIDVTGVSKLMSDDRNSFSHYGYVGVDYDVTAKLRASVRVGAQFTEYSELDESTANPYADASLSYTFVPGTSLEAGIRHARSATDVVAVDSGGNPTTDSETTALYAALHHRLMRNLTASLLVQYQISSFEDGINDGETEKLFLAGVNFEYHFNRHFSAELGYNYDELDSDINGTDRSYRRNRIYIGLKATY
ncbi:MAG TPA: outer membrane beta-barrel protein [Verrucomicrobiae bacterium]